METRLKGDDDIGFNFNRKLKLPHSSLQLNNRLGNVKLHVFKSSGNHGTALKTNNFLILSLPGT